MYTVNMKSQATSIKGQGVGSCYEEQVKLVTNGLSDDFKVYINSNRVCDITHYHTINLRYFIQRILYGKKSVHVGYVHFLPDTLDESIQINIFFRKIFYKYLLAFYNSMDYLVTVNPLIIEKLKNYNITKPQTICIPNFVAKDTFYPILNQNKNKLRAEFNLPENKFIVLCAGQLQVRKGFFDFIETAKLTPNVEFVWAGGFSFGVLSAGYQEIKEITENPPPNVKFLGIINRENMNNLYNCCDLFFLPSYDELFPMAILEALSCEKPILLRDVEIYKNILFNHYIKAADAKGFSHKIIKIMNDSNEYEKWKAESKACSGKYSEANILKMWKTFYSNAVMDKINIKESESIAKGTLNYEKTSNSSK